MPASTTVMRVVYSANIVCCAVVGSLSLCSPEVGSRTVWQNKEAGGVAMQVGSRAHSDACSKRMRIACSFFIICRR